MIAVFIVFVVFLGIAMVVGTVGVSILFANGTITFPGTNQRRLQAARVDAKIQQLRLEQEARRMQFELERERAQELLDQILASRLNKALSEPSFEVIPFDQPGKGDRDGS